LPEEKRKYYRRQLEKAKEEKILKEQAPIRKLGISAAADIRATVTNFAEGTATLPERAGYAIMAFGAKTDYAGATAPFDMVPDALNGFCETVLGMPPGMIALKMETWLLSGGASSFGRGNPNEQSVDVRSDIAKLLTASFGE
jgi:hypothetical protein